MRGIVKSFARSRGRIAPHRAVVWIEGVKHRKHAAGLHGKQVVLKHGNKTFSGTITGHHGDTGKVHVRFRKPLPAQAIRGKVEIK